MYHSESAPWRGLVQTYPLILFSLWELDFWGGGRGIETRQPPAFLLSVLSTPTSTLPFPHPRPVSPITRPAFSQCLDCLPAWSPPPPTPIKSLCVNELVAHSGYIRKSVLRSVDYMPTECFCGRSFLPGLPGGLVVCKVLSCRFNLSFADIRDTDVYNLIHTLIESFINVSFQCQNW